MWAANIITNVFGEVRNVSSATNASHDASGQWGYILQMMSERKEREIRVGVLGIGAMEKTSKSGSEVLIAKRRVRSLRPTKDMSILNTSLFPLRHHCLETPRRTRTAYSSLAS